MAAKLLITVDTEEEFDWNRPVSSDSRGVTNIDKLNRLQDIFDAVGVRPTYVVDHPVATTESSIRVLQSIQDSGRCEIGAHMHPWVNPPIEEEICPANSYVCNLPASLQEQKIGHLTDAVTEAFGRPVTYKAGRYGFDFQQADMLCSFGYEVDTSVLAFMDLSEDGGPVFSDFSNEAFWIKDRDGKATLLEIPCSVGFSRRPFEKWAKWHDYLSKCWFRGLKPAKVLSASRLLRKTLLMPELEKTKDMLNLVRSLAEQEDAVMNLSLHSPSVEPGFTPYVNSEDELQYFLDRLRTVLLFAIRQLNAQPVTHAELVAEYRTGSPSAASSAASAV